MVVSLLCGVVLLGSGCSKGKLNGGGKTVTNSEKDAVVAQVGKGQTSENIQVSSSNEASLSKNQIALVAVISQSSEISNGCDSNFKETSK